MKIKELQRETASIYYGEEGVGAETPNLAERVYSFGIGASRIDAGNNIDRWRLKRKLLESHAKNPGHAFRRGIFQIIEGILRVGLTLTRLQARGERNALSPVVRKMTFEIEGLPAAFSGFQILHLSDLHIDGLAGLAESVYERIRSLEVDLCVFTGDYRFKTSGSSDRIYPLIETILKGVNARFDPVGILGNHDFSEKVDPLERLGIRMLINDAMEIQKGTERIWILGVDDPRDYACDDLPLALTDVPDEAFKILLVHTPEIIEQAYQNGIQVYLCGHTHGGQICLPRLGPMVINADCDRQYAHGVWEYGCMKGYTSAGVGVSGVPVRFFCPPEIGLIELRCPIGGV